MVREDNKDLKRTEVYAYDNNGNRISSRRYGYTQCRTEELEEKEAEEKEIYSYDGDRLIGRIREENGQKEEKICVYDNLGNPTKYLVTKDTVSNNVRWSETRQLSYYGGTSFSYDVRGKRLQKGTKNYSYDREGRLLKQGEELEFLYDDKGVVGFVNAEGTYFYRKDILGNITGILDSDGKIVVRYRYDAWGNHVVLNPDGSENESSTFIGNINPFRYRGYYYDVETGLYYLKTRYYDPETGRFITIDDISYLAPDTINGLNLYAYCGNNPVMRVDENGNVWWNPFSWDWGTIGEIIIGAVVSTLGSGFVFQVAVSTISYVGMAIGAIFSKDIRNDMNRIHWNPFNSNEELVLESKYVSFYKGAPIFRLQKSRDQARPGSFFGILLPKGSSIDDVRHEWGHILQLIIMGFIFYGSTVAIPSICEWGEWGNYYDAPWETLADMFGGVVSREHTPEQKKRAIKYFLLSYFFGCLAYFMVK